MKITEVLGEDTLKDDKVDDLIVLDDHAIVHNGASLIGDFVNPDKVGDVMRKNGYSIEYHMQQVMDVVQNCDCDPGLAGQRLKLSALKQMNELVNKVISHSETLAKLSIVDKSIREGNVVKSITIPEMKKEVIEDGEDTGKERGARTSDDGRKYGNVHIPPSIPEGQEEQNSGIRPQ